MNDFSRNQKENEEKKWNNIVKIQPLSFDKNIDTGKSARKSNPFALKVVKKGKRTRYVCTMYVCNAYKYICM